MLKFSINKYDATIYNYNYFMKAQKIQNSHEIIQIQNTQNDCRFIFKKIFTDFKGLFRDKLPKNDSKKELYKYITNIIKNEKAMDLNDKYTI